MTDPNAPYDQDSDLTHIPRSFPVAPWEWLVMGLLSFLTGFLVAFVLFT